MRSHLNYACHPVTSGLIEGSRNRKLKGIVERFLERTRNAILLLITMSDSTSTLKLHVIYYLRSLRGTQFRPHSAFFEGVSKESAKTI